MLAYKRPQERTEQEWRAYKNWLQHPVEAVKDWFKVTPDDWQGDVLTALFTGGVDRVAGKAAHGPGKTAIDAWAGWIMLNCFENSRVVATAPTFAQLHDVLFPEFAKWHNKFPKRMEEEWVISGGHIRHKGNPNVWFAVARTSNRPENLQGFHGNDLLIIGDEGSAIPQPVFEVMEGALSEAGEEGKTAKLLLAGNPNFNSGELHDAFNRNRDLYHRITITGDPELLKELNLKQGEEHRDHGRVYYSPRVKKKYVETIIKKYGRDSAVFDVRVKGIFPRAADDAIFPLAWCERATMYDLPPYDMVADGVTIVVDPSRGGAAETCIGSFRKGVCTELDAHKTTSTLQVVNEVHEKVLLHKKNGLKILEIIVDEPGVGGGVIDSLRRDFNYPVRPYNGSKPLVKGVDPEDECRMFQNRRARDHWIVRRRLEQESLRLPNDEVLIAQMATIKFFYNTQEKIQVESKQDLKDRLGPEASPDRSDVIVMGTAPWYDAAASHGSLRPEDIIEGFDDRDTSSYREEMDAGLV